VLLAPSWYAMQELLSILERYCTLLDLTCNATKTVCMKFDPKERSKIVAATFPCFTLCGQALKFTTDFRYLGHIITERLKDDSDINREIRNMYIRSNTLIRRFRHCSEHVKVRLFKSYCICLYGSALWNSYSNTSIKRLKACYHKCMKMFFGYKRSDSVTDILIKLSLPSFDTILHNSRYVFRQTWQTTTNEVVSFLRSICVGP